MSLHFEEYFVEYEKLVAGVDAVFSQVAGQFSGEVVCKSGCSSCCYAVFDLFLIEALYLNHKFLRLPEFKRNEILKRADFADRQAYKIKREMGKKASSGTSEDILLQKAAEIRIRCPLLDDNDCCVLYDCRPITCRLYGIPVDISGVSHTCGLSKFETGGAYPTVHLEKIQGRLEQISSALAEGIGSRYSELGQVLVPVSAALLTEYTAEYLGITVPQNKGEQKK